MSPLDDERFLRRLNSILSESGLDLPALSPGAPPSGDALAVWVDFLQRCVRAGIPLSDARWGRLTFRRKGSSQSLGLAGGEGDSPAEDDDFTVGLQLLMGMFSGGRDPQEPPASS